MAVKRVSATLARTQELPYTTFLNSTIELIKNPDALAVYTYLQTKAEHWIVRREDVMSRFSIGKHRYTEAMSHLRQLGLVERSVTRDSAGRVTDNQLIIHYAPNDLPSGLRVNGNPDELDSGESGHLETDQSFKNKSMDSNNTIGTSADAPCGVCFGKGSIIGVYRAEDCQHCNGTGKEPHTDKPVDLTHSQDTPVPESKAANGSAAKPKKPRTDAEKLVNLVKSKPELCVCLNCLDDELLTEWAKLRVKMKASDSDRALKKIESALEELRTVHRIAPDIAIEMQCDKGWRGLEVDWVMNNLNQNRPNMAAPVKSGAPCPTSASNQERQFVTAEGLTQEQREENAKRIREMKGLL